MDGVKLIGKMKKDVYKRQAKTFTDKEIADYGLTSLYFTRKDFIKWWMAP